MVKWAAFHVCGNYFPTLPSSEEWLLRTDKILLNICNSVGNERRFTPRCWSMTSHVNKSQSLYLAWVRLTTIHRHDWSVQIYPRKRYNHEHSKNSIRNGWKSPLKFRGDELEQRAISLVKTDRGFAFVYLTVLSCRLLSRQLKLKHSSMKIAVVKSNICTDGQYNWTSIPFISTQESHSTSLVGRSSICNFEAPNSNMNATRRSNQWHDVLISFTVVPCRLLSRQNTLAVVKSNICTE